MKIKTLEQVLEDELKDLYSAETQLVKALPKMAKKASSPSLKEAISSHLEETEQHVQRLEKCGKILEIKLTGKTCKAMKGLLEEGAEVLEEEGNKSLIDICLIAAAQRVEHYEMSGYGTARAIAEQLGESEVAELLQATLDEEVAADEKLTDISEDELLPQFENEGEDDSDEDEVSDRI